MTRYAVAMLRSPFAGRLRPGMDRVMFLPKSMEIAGVLVSLVSGSSASAATATKLVSTEQIFLKLHHLIVSVVDKPTQSSIASLQKILHVICDLYFPTGAATPRVAAAGDDACLFDSLRLHAVSISKRYVSEHLVRTIYFLAEHRQQPLLAQQPLLGELVQVLTNYLNHVISSPVFIVSCLQDLGHWYMWLSDAKVREFVARFATFSVVDAAQTVTAEELGLSLQTIVLFCRSIAWGSDPLATGLLDKWLAQPFADKSEEVLRSNSLEFLVGSLQMSVLQHVVPLLPSERVVSLLKATWTMHVSCFARIAASYVSGVDEGVAVLYAVSKSGFPSAAIAGVAATAGSSSSTGAGAAASALGSSSMAGSVIGASFETLRKDLVRHRLLALLPILNEWLANAVMAVDKGSVAVPLLLQSLEILVQAIPRAVVWGPTHAESWSSYLLQFRNVLFSPASLAGGGQQQQPSALTTLKSAVLRVIPAANDAVATRIRLLLAACAIASTNQELLRAGILVSMNVAGYPVADVDRDVCHLFMEAFPWQLVVDSAASRMNLRAMRELLLILVARLKFPIPICRSLIYSSPRLLLTYLVHGARLHLPVAAPAVGSGEASPAMGVMPSSAVPPPPPVEMAGDVGCASCGERHGFVPISFCCSADQKVSVSIRKVHGHGGLGALSSSSSSPSVQFSKKGSGAGKSVPAMHVGTSLGDSLDIPFEVLFAGLPMGQSAGAAVPSCEDPWPFAAAAAATTGGSDGTPAEADRPASPSGPPPSKRQRVPAA